VLRSLWFWTTVFIIAIGIALTAALGVFYWLVVACVLAGLTSLAALLAAGYVVGPPAPLVPWPPEHTAPTLAEPTSVIYDCDITLGVPCHDVGDGLALLYLLGAPEVNLLGVTTTYGHGTVETTTRTARRVLHCLGQGDVPLTPGAPSAASSPADNRAAHYLVQTVGDRPGEIVLIATGCMTNLRHAAALDGEFFSKLRALYLWGGITGPLNWNGHAIAELNFSNDPEAAYQALHADCPVTVVPGQAGLTAVFRAPQMAALQASGMPIARWLARRIRLWFALCRLWFHDGGFIIGDSIAALAHTHPETLEMQSVYVTSTPLELRTGRLYVDPSSYGPTQLVLRVNDYEAFITAHFAAWQHLRLGR